MKIKTRPMIMEYSKNTLFIQYLKGLISILIIPFILFDSAIFFFNYKSVSGSFKNTSEQILTRNIPTLDTLFEFVYQGYETLLQNDCTINFLSMPYFNNNNPNFRLYETGMELSELLGNLTLSSGYLDSIHVYSTLNDYFFSSSTNNFRNVFYDNECYELYQKHDFNDFIDVHEINGTKMITICYSANLWQNNSGAVFFNLDTSKLANTLINKDNSDGTLLLATQNNNLLFSSDGEYESYDTSVCKNSSYNHIETLHSKDFIYAYTNLMHDNFKLIYMITSKEYYTIFYPFIQTTLLYILFSVAVMIMIAVFGALRLYNSISETVATIENPNNDKSSYNEFAFLTDTMLANIKTAHNVESNLTEKVQSLKRFQALALQTQINPHFLFNSLNLISSFALELSGEDSPLVVIIDKLSDILRFSLKSKSFIIKIGDEWSNTEKYIEIENIKHENSIDFTYDIDEEIFEYYTVKMILQPLIENAITHGVKSLRHEQGRIKISLKHDSDTIKFAILNNGIPIPEERLSELQSMLENPTELPDNNHIGLNNVNQRIKLIFGNDYGCTINSDSEGTLVTVTFPKITRDDGY